MVRLGFDVGGITTFQTIAQIIAFPLMAACANARLGLAATLVSLPTLFGVLGVIAFAIGVAVNGF